MVSIFSSLHPVDLKFPGSTLSVTAARHQSCKGNALFQLDHITIAADNLHDGVAHAEAALGVSIPVGGAHPLMGTHNHLIRLGDTLFLEIIAPDPAASPLSRRRWFSLDDPKLRSELAVSPRFVTWVLATDDIETALREVPHAAGPAVTVTRGDLVWLISVPDDGSMPSGGAFPTLIQWPRGPHPASRMPDLGCSLVSFDIAHPDADLIGRSLRPFFDDPRVRFSAAAKPSLSATIRTPQGERQLA
jgi:Glyoxalase-like domain